ncbi:MAG: hypothetical protein ACRDZN_03060, partial [Acidimicrobiales bacterium]
MPSRLSFRSSTATLGAALALSGLLAASCGSDDSSSTAGTAETTGSTETTDQASGDSAEPVIDPGDGGDYQPDVDPANFVETIDNPYLPYAPGSSWTYEGTDEGETERVEVVVTDDRREVMGIS